MPRSAELFALAEHRLLSYAAKPGVRPALRSVRRFLERHDLDRIAVDCDGLSLTGGFADRTLLLDTARHAREAFSLRLWTSLAEPGSKVVDVGAHVGVFTLLAARRVGERGHVWAIEPNPQSFRHLRRNVRKNGFENVTTIEVAASDRTGSAVLSVLAGDRTQSSVLDLGKPLDGQFDVDTARVDELMGPGVSKVDVVKIDTEGSEVSVLRGMRRLMATVRAVIVECNETALLSAGSSPRELASILEREKFDIYAINEDRRTLISAPISADWPRGVFNFLAVRPDAQAMSVIESLQPSRL